MDELVRWLGDQLDTDERIARGADPGPWKSNSLGRHDQAAIKVGTPTSTSLIQFDGSRAAANGVHVAWHDPARVLREIDAKRQIIAEHKPDRPEYLPHRELGCRTCSTAQAWDEKANEANCLTLRLLALPYVDRPGYREEWRP